MDEIINSLKKYKTGKSPGPDGIPGEFFKYLQQSGINKLSILFNKILEEERLPDPWTHFS